MESARPTDLALPKFIRESLKVSCQIPPSLNYPKTHTYAHTYPPSPSALFILTPYPSGIKFFRDPGPNKIHTAQFFSPMLIPLSFL